MAPRRVFDSFVPRSTSDTYALVGDGVRLCFSASQLLFLCAIGGTALHIHFFALQFFDFESKSYFEQELFVGRRTCFPLPAFSRTMIR
jgi:hypothetical protein